MHGPFDFNIDLAAPSVPVELYEFTIKMLRISRVAADGCGRALISSQHSTAPPSDFTYRGVEQNATKRVVFLR